jgi:hypothetical protein
MTQLRALPAHVPAPAAAPVGCDDAALAKHGKADERLWIDAFDADALKALPGKPSEDFKWLNGLGARKFLGTDSEGKPATGWDAAQLQKLGLVALLSSTERRLPKVDGDKFSAGTFKGALQIVDLAKATVVCETPLVFDTASEVEYRSRGMFSKSAERAVQDDFEQRAKRAGTAALRSISKVAFISTSGGGWGDE